MLMHDQYLYHSPAKAIYLYHWSLQITITLTEGALIIFFKLGVEKLLGKCQFV